MAAERDFFNLDFYLDSVEELLKDIMQNPLCTPHEVALIGAHTERVLQRARRHSRLASKMPFSTHPSCLSSSAAAPDPYPAFRAEKMLQLPKGSGPEASSSSTPASAAAIPDHNSGSGSELYGLSTLSAPSLQSSVIPRAQVEFKNNMADGKRESQPGLKEERLDNQLSSAQNYVLMPPSLMESRTATTGAFTTQQNSENSHAGSMAPPSRRVSMKNGKSDRMKFVSVVSSWKTGERQKKGTLGLFDPLGILQTLEHAARNQKIELSKTPWTAFQITALIASLGSSEAVLGCRQIIIRLRDFESSHDLPQQTKHPRSFLTSYLPLSSPMENLQKLATRFFEDPLTIPKDHDFEYRHYVTQFCKYILLHRDILMGENREMSAEKAMIEVYASVVTKVKPKSTRFRSDGTVNLGFKAYQTTLEGNTLRGFRWLKLIKRFGVSILALYHTQGKYSRSADVTIDTRDLKDEEFELLLEHLDEEGNANFQWLKRICGLVNRYIDQGLHERLTLPRLSVESGPEARILACNERTEDLAMLLMPV